MITVHSQASGGLGPVRHQGQRGTCLAFTASDLNAAANDTEHLSVDYLCHHAARAMPGWQSHEGFTIEAILSAAHQPGQPLEAQYPYSPNNPAAPLVVPHASLAPLYASPAQQRGLGVPQILERIGAGQPVGVVVAVTPSLFRPINEIVVFDQEVLPDQYHAMIAVAVGHHAQSGELHVQLRNSWGVNWGGNGHAWVSRPYLDMHLVEGVTF
jgi:C1A family cysteine protease